jgi:hypothetical protein
VTATFETVIGIAYTVELVDDVGDLRELADRARG